MCTRNYVEISAYMLNTLSRMEEIYGSHLKMHDKLRNEYRAIVGTAVDAEKKADGSLVLYFNSNKDELKASKRIDLWWSDVLTFSSGND